jgi:hypothetical protein
MSSRADEVRRVLILAGLPEYISAVDMVVIKRSETRRRELEFLAEDVLAGQYPGVEYVYALNPDFQNFHATLDDHFRENFKYHLVVRDTHETT